MTEVLGNSKIVDFEFTRLRNGVLEKYDPSVVKISILKIDEKEIVHEDSITFDGSGDRDDQLIRNDVGSYTLTYDLDIVGSWRIRALTETTEGAHNWTSKQPDEVSFYVEADPHQYIDR